MTPIPTTLCVATWRDSIKKIGTNTTSERGSSPRNTLYLYPDFKIPGGRYTFVFVFVDEISVGVAEVC